MALVLMCGQPCSGKSSVAACLVQLLAAQSPSYNIVLLDEPSLNLDRNQSYRDMPSEKNLRGSLRSAIDRAVSKDKIVIVDSLNNIKGYRYELWCIARASGLRYCVLHCIVGEGDSRAWNRLRQERGDPCYEDKILDDLMRRFEMPDQRNRWDSPLFEFKTAEEQINISSSMMKEVVTFLNGKGCVAGRTTNTLQPTIATQNARASDTNSLYELDRATQEVIAALVDAQSQGFGTHIQNVAVGEEIPVISFKRNVGLPELRRLRRTFLKLAGQSSLSGPPPPSDAVSAKRMFADYLNRELQ